MDHFVSMNGEGRRLALDVALAPRDVAAASPGHARTVYIVVDVIRATTTLSLLFERRCRRVYVAADIAHARTARVRMSGPVVLAGEQGGRMPHGFDLGNSPSELANADVAGRDVIFATTNGTRALRACLGGRAILAGSLRNASAVCAAALASSDMSAPDWPYPNETHPVVDAASEADLDDVRPDVVIVCSGRGDQPAFDDTLCAGYLIEKLLALAAVGGARVRLGEGARIAHGTLTGALNAYGTLLPALTVSDAARAVKQIGLEADLACCAMADSSVVVPRVADVDTARDLLILDAS